MLGQSPWEAAGTEITIQQQGRAVLGTAGHTGSRAGTWGVAARQHPQLCTPPSSVIHQCSERCLITASAFLFPLFIILPQHLECYRAAGLELPALEQ